MPHTSSAKKHQRQSEKRRRHNRSVVKDIKLLFKDFDAALEDKKPLDELKKLYNLTAKKLDKAAAKQVLHPNQAARKKSQLARAIHRQAKAAPVPAKA